MIESTQTILFLFAVGVFTLYLVFKNYREWSLIKDIPRSKVRSLAMGLVELHGKPRIKEAQKSPITGEDCVFWRLKIQVQQRTGKSSSWNTVYDKCSTAPFYLEDETGAIPIIPEDARVEISNPRKYYGKPKLVFPGKNVFFPEYGSETLDDVTENSLFSGKRLFLYQLHEGDDFFVMGTAKTSSEGPFIAKGENEKTFIIANGTENSVLKRIQTRMILSALGSVAPIGLGIFLVI